MTDVTLPDGSDPAWQNGIAQLRALGSPLSNIGSLGQAGIRALALAPSVMASASGGAQEDMGGLPGAIANAATADFRGPFAGMTGRDVLLKTMGAIYGPAVTAWASSDRKSVV